MRNVGKRDRAIRLGFFVLFVATGSLLEGTLKWVSWTLSAVMLMTGTVGFCPLWALFKVNTLEDRWKKGG